MSVSWENHFSGLSLPALGVRRHTSRPQDSKDAFLWPHFGASTPPTSQKRP